MRDIERDYREAMIGEYEMYRNGGQEQAAAHVAAALKEQYGYDVADAHPELDEFSADSPEDDPDVPEQVADPEAESDKPVPDVPERADEPAAPENTAVPKPARAAKKAAPAKPPAR